MRFSSIIIVALTCLFALSAAKNQTPTVQKLFDMYTQAYLTGAPSGEYKGSASVLGQKITMDITSESTTTCHIVATGPVPVDCDKEAWTYANGVITLPNASKAGDCVYTALSAAGCSIAGITYDPTADQITVKLKYSFITISIVLSKVATPEPLVPRTAVVAVASSPSLKELVDNYFTAFAIVDPAGTYKGTKTILGETVTGIIIINANTTFDFYFQGPTYIYCPNEPYTYANGVITVTNINTPGDCLYDALNFNSITLSSITYDTSSDSITVTVKFEFITIPFELDHQA